MDFEDRCTAFFNLLGKPLVRKLLRFDTCYTIADKYHLATVFYIFFRANFEARDYNERNFHLALYLSHDIHEDLDCFKECITDNLLTPYCSNEELVSFLDDKFDLFLRIQFDVIVEREICELLFCDAPHKVWNRTRSQDHAGAIKQILCKKCSHKYSI